MQYNYVCCPPRHSEGKVLFYNEPVSPFIYGTYLTGRISGSTSAMIFNHIIQAYDFGYWVNNLNNQDCLMQNNGFISSDGRQLSEVTVRNSIFNNSEVDLQNCSFDHNLFVDDDVSKRYTNR